MIYHHESSKALIRNLYANALTVLNNKEDLLPLKELNKIRIATLAINKNKITTYQHTIEKYLHSDHFTLNPDDPKTCADILEKLSEYDLVIAGIFGLDQRPNTGFGIKPGMDDFIEKLT